MSNVNCRLGNWQSPGRDRIHLAEFLLRVRLATSHTHISSSWQPRLLRSSLRYQCSQTPFFGPIHRFASSAQRGFINLASRSMRSPARDAHATRGQKLRMLRFPRHIGKGNYAQLTPFQKAATALGTGALTGMGQYYRE